MNQLRLIGCSDREEFKFHVSCKDELTAYCAEVLGKIELFMCDLIWAINFKLSKECITCIINEKCTFIRASLFFSSVNLFACYFRDANVIFSSLSFSFDIYLFRISTSSSILLHSFPLWIIRLLFILLHSIRHSLNQLYIYISKVSLILL